MVVPSTSTEKSIGTLAGASIRCWPMTTPASAVAVVSTIVTIATAAGVRVTVSSVVSEPVTELLAAMAGMTNSPLSSARATPSNPSRRRVGRERNTARPQGFMEGRGASSAPRPSIEA